ncbi:L-aspartate oxidase [Tenacibaculum finnmarkense genomovar finnmarkense]|uniref:L-aspartate oxidase n=1 Tax=Tenacibaculum finnmarkense TaxID=2781243 RepID=UPI001E45C956|nr:L-aspartate oxidase [Tenacibaculum finnmarkense]MCD8416971.1 L-aspartate oxidase [Tenacibaculum finnmarkense genomovar finnmarkense]MCG8201774.1 L-aspartate oxidase [Tenacibaculum finnmarkense genomovar finnmarkense]MCG8209477.1 L-aspartate oxidase [Tenacibaculum finnmarkense genomovar finnmarkense]MCG8212273.1 L-aspartate oxidase [Tenacibaculum finnmarkense genomovar finnmarkense]MCG8219485.1 L-aspartate oxidase [Tenacibaculum finnmarkense genomovar finnmarkense]
MIKTNYLVIGSGVAGLTFAVKMAEKFPDKTITIITKANEDESNTKYAQGGVAVVLDKDEDSFQKHIADTLIAGAGLCDKKVVEMVVKQGPKRFKELVLWGANFDTDSTGAFDLAKEGGHSEYRVVHHKDITGYEVERALLKRVHQLKNVTVLPHYFAIDLITNHQLKTVKPSTKLLKNTTEKSIESSTDLTCFGAYVLNQKTSEIFTIKADNTLLASGGVGSVYGHTTNPVIATGDGIAMAYRAKATILDMEFVQFHPTVLYQKEQNSSFLISEAVRGFGAYLRDKKGNRFMPTYDKRAELASRNIVSQCIYKELQKSGDTQVYLDCTHLDIESFKNHFPTIYQKCKSLHIDIAKDWIPVVPASHYMCGGIVVDKNGKTAIKNLFSCGEASRTGLHGANRLASNSLLEALVYADNIYKFLAKNSLEDDKLNQINQESDRIPQWKAKKIVFSDNEDLIKQYVEELQQLMRNNAGIVRSNEGLENAKIKLAILYNKVETLYKNSKISVPLCELRNMVNVAHLIINQSAAQSENKGGHYNIDHILARV